MRRNSAFVTIAFLAGLGIGLFLRSAAVLAAQQNDAHVADLAAIEKLHKADEECTLTQDPACLTALWSDDGVNLGFPGAPVVGIKAMREAYEKARAQFPDLKVLKYAPDVKGVQILDEWAIEVISGESTFRLSATGNPVSVQGRSMRLLKRQDDGSWKFALVGLK